MIRFRLIELISDAQMKTGRRVTVTEVSAATGINRITLSRMINVPGYSTSTETIDKLCKFFGCDVGDIAKFVPEAETVPKEPAKVAGKRPATKAIPAPRKTVSRRS